MLVIMLSVRTEVAADERIIPHHIPISGHRPDPEQRVFFAQTSCLELCVLPCRPMFAENEKTFFICQKLKPIEKSFHERIIAEASWPWLLFVGVLAFCILFCCGCACWSCCCKQKDDTDTSSREPLAGRGGIEEIIPDEKQRYYTGSKHVEVV
jgi:hypothetical protein